MPCGMPGDRTIRRSPARRQLCQANPCRFDQSTAMARRLETRNAGAPPIITALLFANHRITEHEYDGTANRSLSRTATLHETFPLHCSVRASHATNPFGRLRIPGVEESAAWYQAPVLSRRTLAANHGATRPAASAPRGTQAPLVPAKWSLGMLLAVVPIQPARSPALSRARHPRPPRTAPLDISSGLCGLWMTTSAPGERGQSGARETCGQTLRAVSPAQVFPSRQSQSARQCR